MKRKRALGSPLMPSSLALVFGVVLGVSAALYALPVQAEEGGEARSPGGIEERGLSNDLIERQPLPELKVPPRDLDAVSKHHPKNDDAELQDELAVGETLKNPQNVNAVLQKALQAYRQKRIQDAIVGFEVAAKNNSFIAQFLLAHIYRTGKAGIVNHRRAYEYYLKITNDFVDANIQYSRHAPYVAHAFVQLARYIEAGVEELDIKADPEKARILFEKAAHFGDVEGQYQLGRFLIESGQVRNVRLGQRWLTRAAVKNNAKAQAYLGALYWQGDLVGRKQALALAWIEFARRNASGPVKNQVERLYDAVRFDMNQKQQAKAELYITRLRSKYNVLWRESPRRPEEEENEFLGGIVLADPPQNLDPEQLEARGPGNQYIEEDMPESTYYGRMEGGTGFFGFQFYNQGRFQGQ